MKKKFAFLLMGSSYTTDMHRAQFETEKDITYIYTVKNFHEAEKLLLSLQKEGVGAVELCGAFGEENAQKLIDLTNNTIAIGYVVHKPKQDNLFEKFFL